MDGIDIQHDAAGEIAAVHTLIAAYTRSIDAADADLAARLWEDAPQASLIHPRGTERGWHAVRDRFYGEAMGATFSARRLVVENVAVALLGEAALVTFDWTFQATVRADGSLLRTQGRESQVLRRTPAGWRILHIHYSGPAMTGALEGF